MDGQPAPGASGFAGFGCAGAQLDFPPSNSKELRRCGPFEETIALPLVPHHCTDYQRISFLIAYEATSSFLAS
jgi:hypothetical protein